jgi:hypothetical protein
MRAFNAPGPVVTTTPRGLPPGTPLRFRFWIPLAGANFNHNDRQTNKKLQTVVAMSVVHQERRSMRISGLAVAVVALMLVGANANAQSESAVSAGANDKSGQNSARAPVVKGRAVYEDTGQPALRHRVQLVGIEVLANRRVPHRIPTTMTDANGEFIFRHALRKGCAFPQSGTFA